MNVQSAKQTYGHTMAAFPPAPINTINWTELKDLDVIEGRQTTNVCNARLTATNPIDSQRPYRVDVLQDHRRMDAPQVRF